LTVPVGDQNPEIVGLTVAVKVKVRLAPTTLAVVVNVVLVVVGSTTCVTVPELARKLLSLL
jgi:hypothetical protein